KLGNLISELRNIPIVKDISSNESTITAFTTSGDQLLPKIFQKASDLGMKLETISLTKPTLDDVFLSYTGKGLREDNGRYDRKKERERMRKIRA
ncbi:MAG: ABC transporter ATP-binding protein, partial [Thaumarchaeota archaeon]|nr:ABC transporter ATP-binding protein [Nitrososphaerota archaeon]